MRRAANLQISYLRNGPLFASAIVCMLSLPVCAFAQSDNSSEKIESQISQIRNSHDEGMRAYISEHMSGDIMILWEAKQTGKIDRQAIVAITALLDDDSDAVRSEAASSLGMIGSRARSAVPALHRALKRIQDENRRPLEEGEEIRVVESDSEAPIRVALRRIAGIPDDLDEQARTP